MRKFIFSQQRKKKKWGNNCALVELASKAPDCIFQDILHSLFQLLALSFPLPLSDSFFRSGALFSINLKHCKDNRQHYIRACTIPCWLVFSLWALLSKVRRITAGASRSKKHYLPTICPSSTTFLTKRLFTLEASAASLVHCSLQSCRDFLSL